METTAPIQDLAQVTVKWQDTMLSLEKEYEQEPEVLKIGGVPVGTLGNFSASIGKAKSKKTFNVSAMVAAALSGKEVLNYTTDFPEGKDRILYIDTEQSQNHCMIVMHRIMKLAELPANEDCGRFYFLALRKFNPKERLAIIDDAISQIEGLGFVVIDGIRDLVYDINSPSEATCVISKLMQWTDIRQLPCQPRPVFCHGIVAVAYAGVNRVLKHVIPILYQKVAKSSGFPPLLFCLDGQVKKYKHSHKSTHNRGAAMPAASAAPKRRPFPCRCAGFAPAVPWRKPRCGAVRRKECQRSSARTARA